MSVYETIGIKDFMDAAGSPAMGVGLAYGHIGSQALNRFSRGGDLAEILGYQVLPTVVGSVLIGNGMKKFLGGGKDADGRWLLLGTLIGAIGSSIKIVYDEDRKGERDWAKNSNFHMIILLTLFGIGVALGKDGRGKGYARMQSLKTF